MGSEMEDRNKIVAFDGEGFHNWKFRLETVLDMHDLLQCLQQEVDEMVELHEVDGDSEAVRAEKKKKVLERRKKEKRCKSIIVQSIADSQLELVKECQTPKQIWETLRNVFERKGVAGQLYVRKQLLTLRYVEGAGKTMAEHLVNFDKLIRELKGSGANVEESDAVCHLLLTLPASFDPVVTAIETLPGGVTMDFVKRRLLDVDMKKRNLESSGEASSSHDGLAMATSKKKKIKCFLCGKLGHKKADCRVVKLSEQKSPKPRNESSKQKAHVGVSEEQPEIAFLMAESEELVKVGWFIDSGATDHMMKDADYFSSMRRLDSPVEIVVANGQKLRAEYCGDITLYTVVGGVTKKCVAKNVLFLPGLSCNLFSVKRVAKAGLKVCFDGDKAEIVHNDVVTAVGWLKGKLYELDIYCKPSEAGAAMVSGKVPRDALLWHQRYGHVGCESLRELVKHEMVDGLQLKKVDDDVVVCEPCLSGKIVQLPFTPSEERRSSRLLELIHSDVCGPMKPVTWDGKRFMVSFIDDYSHFTVVFLLDSKDQVFERFRDYEALVTARFGSRISRLRTDNGGEYANDAMRDFCRKKGIAMEFTVPYTPQQNGVSERMNRTLMERARALLAESGFEKEMWGEAVYTATYITNRCPTSAVDEKKTPFELWNGRKPDVKKLRVFGSAAYLHVPKELRSKLDSKCKKLYHVGYTVNGYRLWDCEKRKIVIGRDVVFDENLLFGKRDKVIVGVPKTVDLMDEELNEQSVVPDEETNSDISSCHESDSQDDEEVGEQQHISLRRSGRSRREPVWFDCYEMTCGLAMCAEDFVEDLPTTVDGLKQRSDWPRWKTAIAEEMEALVRNRTWTLTSLPTGRILIDSRWIFKIKRNESGDVDRYKARLVARGFSQRKGLDYEDTYSPVAKLTTLRTLLALVNHNGMHLHQLDVKTAFLNGIIQEDIYMRLPDEFGAGSLVAKLQKSLYGLKQASRAWNARFHDFVIGLGFKRSEADSCLYVAKIRNETVILIIYVDDMLIACHSLDVLISIKRTLGDEFEMTDLKDVNTFLGLTVERNMKDGVLKIGQKSYLRSLLKRFGMNDCKPVKTPLATGLKLEKCVDATKFTQHPYRELVGCLMYLTVTSRPDLCMAVNYFSGFQSCATDEHYSHLKRLLRYIQGTLDIKLVYRKSQNANLLEGFADADWAGDIIDRKSLSGYIFKVQGATVAWSTRKQVSVALSSAEAEYAALTMAVTEAIWLRGLLRELGQRVADPTVIHEDNQACIRVAESDKPPRRMKHVDVRFHFVKNEIDAGTIRLLYVPSEDQIADVLTKGLPRIQFEKLRDLLGLLA